MNNYYDYLNQNQMIDMNYLNNYNNMTNYKNDLDLTNLDTGFIRGNIFNNLYVPYKNYKPIAPVINSEREQLLYEILKLNFAMTELNLYLDTNPNNTNAINLFNDYSKKKKNLVNSYETKFGPLTLDGSMINLNAWSWNKNPWPWEVEK